MNVIPLFKFGHLKYRVVTNLDKKPYFYLKSIVLFFSFILFLPFSANAQLSTLALKNLPIDDLANLDIIVTSASKKPQKLSKTAAALFVISQEDIQNSGVTTIPDALRMAPGIQVARIDVNKWSVTSRGFSGRFANKLLVMIDGRTIYNPLFSGVYWDSHNAQMENIERIEVIRGPGAALWGANAVNGVINIITKTAKDTQGTLISGSAGSELNQGFIRFGDTLGDSAEYRIYANYKNYDDSINFSGQDTADQTDQGQGGFQLDWRADPANRFSLQGDYYEGEGGHNDASRPLLTPPFSNVENVRFKFRGSNVIGRWSHQYSEDNLFKLKLYYDRVDRKSPSFKQSYETVDFELNQQIRTADWNEINWGLGYRLIVDNIKGKTNLTLSPEKRNTHFYSGFIQDELTLIPDILKTTIAVRLDHNDYSGLEFQPTARLLWSPDDQNSIWVAFSRAVRTPSRSSDIRIDQGVIPGTPSQLISIFGNSNADSEEVFAYELGYKLNFSNAFKINFSAFYNIYDELRTFEQNSPVLESSPSPPHILIPIITDNKLEGETYGFEISSTWQPHSMVTLNAAYTYTKINLHHKDNSIDRNGESAEEETPQQQFSLRSDIKITPEWSSNFWFRFVDSLPAQKIKAYVTLDARLAWQAHKQLELSVVGQNLLASHHPEYSPEILMISPSQVERSILGKIVWQF